MGDAVGRSVLAPQRVEVDVAADLPPSVHFGRLSVQLGETDLWRTLSLIMKRA